MCTMGHKGTQGELFLLRSMEICYMGRQPMAVGVNVWFIAAIPRRPHGQGPQDYFLTLERQGANPTPLEGLLCVRESR